MQNSLARKLYSIIIFFFFRHIETVFSLAFRRLDRTLKSFDTQRYVLVNEKIDSWEIAWCKSFNGLVVSRDELSFSLFDRFLVKLDIYVSRIRSHTCEHDLRAKFGVKKSTSLFSVLVGRYLDRNASRKLWVQCRISPKSKLINNSDVCQI